MTPSIRTKNATVLLGLVLAFCFLTGLSASATSYYVSTSGNDANPGTSATYPWKTIQKAAGVVKAGDTVHVASGTYYLGLVSGLYGVYSTHSGTATARITYISDTKWGAKLVSQAAGGSAAWRNTGSYVDIVGFDVSGKASSGLRNDGSYVRFIGNHVHNLPTECTSNGGAGIVHTWQFNGVNNDAIGNVVDHIGPYPNCTGDHGSGIYLQGTGGTIYNNIVNNNGKNGIQLWHAAKNLNISNNVSFKNVRAGITVGDGDSPGGVTADYVNVTNNVSMYNGSYGIQESGATGTHNVYKSNMVYGNTTNIKLQNGLTASGTLSINPTTTSVFVNFQLNGTGDYNLSSTSPLKDKGTSTGAPTYDIRGLGRPVNNSWDVGAYEYGATATTPMTKVSK